MRTRLLTALAAVLFWIGFAFVPICTTSCSIVPAKPIVVQTLLSLGQAAETAVATSALLYQDHKITAAQARSVMDFYTLKFQPAFNAAKDAVNADLSSPANPEVLALGNQLLALVIKLQPIH